MQISIAFALALSVLSIAAGQSPVKTKRVPSTDNAPPLLQQYNFGAQLKTLEDPAGGPGEVTPQLAAPGAHAG